MVYFFPFFFFFLNTARSWVPDWETEEKKKKIDSTVLLHHVNFY